MTLKKRLTLASLCLCLVTSVHASLVSDLRDQCFLRNDYFQCCVQVANELIQIANTGNTEAMYALAQMFGGGGVSGLALIPSKTKAAYWLKEAANHGHIGATVDYGVFLAIGIGVRQSDDLAMQMFRKAASTGDPIAENNIGVLLKKKKRFFGLFENSEAKTWFGKSCDHGYEPACKSYNSFENENHQPEFGHYGSYITMY